MNAEILFECASCVVKVSLCFSVERCILMNMFSVGFIADLVPDQSDFYCMDL